MENYVTRDNNRSRGRDKGGKRAGRAVFGHLSILSCLWKFVLPPPALSLSLSLSPPSVPPLGFVPSQPPHMFQAGEISV